MKSPAMETGQTAAVAQSQPAAPPAPPPPTAEQIIYPIKYRISQDPFSWRGYHELGVAYYNLGRYDEAIAAYLHALSLSPMTQVLEAERARQEAMEAQRAAEMAARQAQIRQQQQQAVMGAALGLLGATRINPGVLSAVGAMAQLAQMPSGNEAQPGGIEAVPESQLKAKREIAEVHDNLGEAYVAREDYDLALKAFQDAMLLDPSRMKTLQNLGYAHFQSRQYDRAIPALNKVLVLNPTPPPPPLYLWLATSYRRQGLQKEESEVFQTAVARIGEAVARSANEPGALNGLADAYFDANYHAEAIAVYERSLAAQRNQARVLRRLGVSYLALGRLDDAARVLRDAVAADRNDTIAWLWLARTQERQGAAADARISYQQATARHEGNRPPSSVSIAAAFAGLGQTDRAIPWLLELSGRKPSSAYRAFELGLAYEKAGRHEDALESMERALWLDPTDALAGDAVQRIAKTLEPRATAALQRAEQTIAAGKPADAIVDLSRALVQLPEGQTKQDTMLKLLRIVAAMPNPPALSDDAQRFFGRGNAALKSAVGPEGLDRAVSEYAAALRRSPWSPPLYLNTALAYGQRKRYTDAILHLKLYLIAAPQTKDSPAVLEKIYEYEYLQELEQRGPALLSGTPLR